MSDEAPGTLSANDGNFSVNLSSASNRGTRQSPSWRATYLVAFEAEDGVEVIDDQPLDGRDTVLWKEES